MGGCAAGVPGPGRGPPGPRGRRFRPAVVVRSGFPVWGGPFGPSRLPPVLRPPFRPTASCWSGPALCVGVFVGGCFVGLFVVVLVVPFDPSSEGGKTRLTLTRIKINLGL